MYEPSHPTVQLSTHSCVSVGNGLITVGGSTSGDNYNGLGFTKDVYLFRNLEWTIAGQLQNV